MTDNGKEVYKNMNFCKKLGSLLLAIITVFSLLSPVFCPKAYAKDDMSPAFKKVLNGGKLVLRSAPPADQDDYLFYSAMDKFMLENPDFGLSIVDEETTSKVTLTLRNGGDNEESHVVDVVWKYNPKVWEEAKKIGANFPASGAVPDLTDMELVNYWAYHNPNAFWQTLVNYSGELKAIVKNTNFTLLSQSHGGPREPFYTGTGGPAALCHNKTLYYAVGSIGVSAQHIIYVPENTADTKQALLAAVQKRIDEYMGKGVIKVTAAEETVTDYYNGELANFDKTLETAKTELPKVQAKLDAEMAKEESERDQEAITQYSHEISTYELAIINTPRYKQNFIDEFKEGGLFFFLKKAAGDFIFEATVPGKDTRFKFVVMKDNSKLVMPSYKSVDLETKISVSTDSGDIPLDTVVEADKLTGGEEYNRICKVVNADDNEMFDIKLHSNSLENHITTLGNGKFLVKIPIPAGFKGKTLSVFYVDAGGKSTEYAVTEKDGYACFETDHFSIYTLAAKSIVTTTTTEPTPTGTDKDTPVDTDADTDTDTDTDTKGSAVLWVVLGILLAAGLGTAGFFAFKKIKKSDNA